MAHGYSFVGLGLKIASSLVIADPHIGYEESLAKEGVLVPRLHVDCMIRKLGEMIKAANPKRIIINGDFKHGYSGISEQEWRDSAKLISFLTKAADVVFVRGNHDVALGPVARKKGINVVEDIREGKFFITHGDSIKKIPKGCGYIVIGHEHPAVSLKEGARVETFKCFLEAEYNGKKLIILPSFNPVTVGHDLVREKPISPYVKNPDSAVVHLIADEGHVIDFGTIGMLKKLR